MAKIVINDLERNSKLDERTMKSVAGGTKPRTRIYVEEPFVLRTTPQKTTALVGNLGAGFQTINGEVILTDPNNP